MPNAPASVAVRGLSKRFGSVEALADVSFDVAPGELFGIVGPDGAGKSTLFRLLATLLLPDAGTATLDGLDLVRDYRALRLRLGYMPGRFSLYPDLTVAENLAFFADVFGTTVAEGRAIVEPIYAQIEPFAHRRAGALSGGMKQKLALSCALVHRPRLLLLDEPTTGVDAVSRAEFWDVLATLRDSGITTLVSTPYMDEAARCDRIALVQDGRLLGPPDTPDAVARAFPAPLVEVRAQRPGAATMDRVALLAALRHTPGVARAEIFGDWMHVTGAGSSGPSADEHLAATVRDALVAAGFADVDVRPVAPSVEDVFLHRMARPDV
ncbi:MAG: ABC transporter ATP-binding protein [Rhodothermales bacterium]|nr:ABC transporter ATP-binding protein [Rhodothermales bacterium]